MLVTKYIEIDMGHRVPNHKSKCFNIHGHRYKFEVGVDDKIIDNAGASDEGMVIDFSDIKQIMMDQIDEKLDHGFMMYSKDELLFPLLAQMKMFKIIVVDFIPTAENIAKYVYNNIKPELEKRAIAIKHVKVWETPTSTAIYTSDNFKEDNIKKINIDNNNKKLKEFL